MYIYIYIYMRDRLKGIVHPKMKILSSFTQPQIVPTCMNVFVLLNTRQIFWRKFVTRLFWGTIDFHRGKKILWKSMVPQNCSFPTFFKISSFVFSRTKTFIQVWNYLRVSKWWQNFHFWVNYPFKVRSRHMVTTIITRYQLEKSAHVLVEL